MRSATVCFFASAVLKYLPCRMLASVCFAHSFASVLRSKVADSAGNPLSQIFARYPVVPSALSRFSSVAIVHPSLMKAVYRKA